MERKKIYFIILALLILAVPLYVMISSENILENGHRHKLRLEGRDPFDPFRGKFLRLNIDNFIECDCDEGDEVYVTLAKDSLGFSYFEKGHQEKPDHDDYFMAEVIGDWSDRIRIKTDNITKYFINEDKALKAEDVVRDYTRERPDDIYLAVRVLDGDIRLEEIFIEEIPLPEFLER